jgi:cytochrome P450
VPSDDHRRLRGWLDVVLAVSGVSDAEVREANERMAAYLGGLIQWKCAEPADDLLTALIDSHDQEDRLSTPELVATTYILLVGGYETTAGLLANSLLTLHRHPEQLALLRDKPELIPGAVEEILRFVPISRASMERVATEDVVLSGVRVPAGTLLIPLPYSANRDEALLNEPDAFDLTREPLPHLAFGHGIHYCLGASLARLELNVAYTTLLRRLPGLRPAVPESDVVWKHGQLTRAPVALPVTW